LPASITWISLPEIADRVDLLPESGKPVIVGDHAAQPFPDTFLGIQLGRVSRLRLEDETAGRFADNLCDAGPRMLRAAVMNDQQSFGWIADQQVPQELRKLLLVVRNYWIALP
jgi:hypothetical protein